MTTFEDGPAKGTTLLLRRTPIFLRVTEEGGKFDALNELKDVARTGEKLFVYKMSKNRGTCHINASGGRGGFYSMVTYKLIEPQPLDLDIRANKDWAAWVVANKDRWGSNAL